MSTEPDREMFDYIEERDNARSQLPEGESVDMLSVWVAECYTPAQVDDLLAGFRRLGWDTSGQLRSPATWIEQWRSSPSGGGYANLYGLVRAGDTGWVGDYIETDLPQIATYGSASLFRLFPGVFTIVVQFYLNTKVRDRIYDVFGHRFAVRTEPFPRGKRFVGPFEQRAEAIATVRKQARAECADWLARHLPGKFASSGVPGMYPTGELLVLDQASPLSAGQGRAVLDFRSLLDLHRSGDAWESSAWPGVRLLMPDRWEPEEFPLVLAANHAEAFDDEDLAMYGGRSRQGLTHRCDYFASAVALWSIHPLLRLYERELSRIREAIAPSSRPDSSSGYAALTSHLEAALLNFSADAVPVVSELAGFVERDGAFDWMVDRFHPAMRDLAASNARQPPPDTPILDQKGVPMAPKTPRPSRTSDDDPHLFEGIRQGFARRSAWILETERIARQLVQAANASANASAQEELSRSNLALQRAVLWLSVLVVGLTIVQVFLAI